MAMSRRFARFNRMFGNRVAGPVFKRLPGFGAVHHRGRKSGREYETPVKIFRRGNSYVVTLPYGSKSDWVKNVLAAGGCELTASGHRIRLTNPELRSDSGQGMIPAPARIALSLLHATEYLVLARADAPEPR